jgi:dihydrodipicolinate synthase/N-acetylneuraminate lyase
MHVSDQKPPSAVLRGIWPPVLLETGKDGRINVGLVEAVTQHFANANVQGVYTGDTASEFYALEFEEWNDLATSFRAVTDRLDIPSGIGCTWTNQAGALRRVKRARELGFHNIHLSQPYWVRLNPPAQRAFWEAVSAVAGQMAVIVYSGGQGQMFLDGDIVTQLREWCPAIAGTKTTGFDAVATNSLLAHTPDLAHFVGEQVLAPWVALGAAGCFSNLAELSPTFAVDWFGLMKNRQWTEAFATQKAVGKFYEAGVVPIRRAGFAVDKALAELGGCPGITRALRPPYQPVPDDLFHRLGEACRLYLPDALKPGT